MSTAILHPNVSEFDELLGGDLPVLVDFWAEWCMPCRMLAPVIEQIGEQYAGRLAVAKVDTDKHPELAQRYGIQSIPTVILFDKGRPVSTEIGLRSLDAYTRKIDALLA
ncbi:MAG TPA: thioredoxin [Firmicutes bacterium]|nr:thioredoxin [Bacillota bacterium]